MENAATTTLEEAQGIANFISGSLRAPPATPSIAVRDPAAVTTSSFFMHGADSMSGAIPPEDDSKDTYQWSLPGSAFKTKIELPRLGNIDEVSVWQAKLMQTTDTALPCLELYHPPNIPTKD